MRVALLTNFIPPYRISLFRELAQRTTALRVFVSTPMDPSRPWTPDWTGLDVVVQKTISLTRTWRTDAFSEPFQVHVPYDTLWQLRRWKPDVIVTGELGARSMQAMLYGKATHTPVVLWATLSDRLEAHWGRARRMLRSWLIRNADAIMVNGASGARYVQRFGAQRNAIFEVPYTTDIAPFVALPLRAVLPPFRMLYVGSVSERKGLRVFLDGLALWAENEPQAAVELTIVGDGPLRAQLMQKRMPPNVRIDWVGNVAYHELPQWFARGIMFVFPSLGDEWGVVVNEALAAGMPVLGSAYAQAVEELIRDGENGWVFVPDSPQQVADALGRALAAPADVLMRMAVNARQSARALEPALAAETIATNLAKLCDARSTA